VMAAAVALLSCAALSLFGFIHSVLPTGGIYLPWTLPTSLPWHWAAAYALLAIVILSLGRTRAFRLDVASEGQSG